MDFATMLTAAWNAHGDHPEDAARTLASSLALIQSDDHITNFARVATHVFGEHLGQWQRGIALLDSLRELPAFAGGADVSAALRRNIATLRIAGGEGLDLTYLNAEDRAIVFANAAAAFAGRNELSKAIDAYAQALDAANADLPDGSPAFRALAVAGNNLASSLEEKFLKDKRDLNTDETAGMLNAARGALKYWQIAGTWLEHERAEYRLARSLLCAHEPALAVVHAQRCLDVCNDRDAPALEQFFAHAVLALAQRAAGDMERFAALRSSALASYQLVESAQQAWCRQELKELG